MRNQRMISIALSLCLLAGINTPPVLAADTYEATTASTFEVKVLSNSTTVAITKYLGTASVVTIPSTIDGKTVTMIDANAFKDTGVTNVIIPSTVIEIGTKAFANCVNLKQIELGATLRNLQNAVFYGCSSLKKVLIENDKMTIDQSPDTIPSTVAIYGAETSTAKQYATANGNKFGALADYYVDEYKYDVPKTNDASNNTITDVTQVGISSYIGTSKTVHIPETIPTSILPTPEGATYPEDRVAVKYVGANAFKGNTDIELVILHNGIISIGSNAFADCTSLTTIIVNSDDTEIDALATTIPKTATIVCLDTSKAKTWAETNNHDYKLLNSTTLTLAEAQKRYTELESYYTTATNVNDLNSLIGSLTTFEQQLILSDIKEVSVMELKERVRNAINFIESYTLKINNITTATPLAEVVNLYKSANSEKASLNLSFNLDFLTNLKSQMDTRIKSKVDAINAMTDEVKKAVAISELKSEVGDLWDDSWIENGYTPSPDDPTDTEYNEAKTALDAFNNRVNTAPSTITETIITEVQNKINAVTNADKKASLQALFDTAKKKYEEWKNSNGSTDTSKVEEQLTALEKKELSTITTTDINNIQNLIDTVTNATDKLLYQQRLDIVKAKVAVNLATQELARLEVLEALSVTDEDLANLKSLIETINDETQKATLMKRYTVLESKVSKAKAKNLIDSINKLPAEQITPDMLVKAQEALDKISDSDTDKMELQAILDRIKETNTVANNIAEIKNYLNSINLTDSSTQLDINRAKEAYTKAKTALDLLPDTNTEKATLLVLAETKLTSINNCQEKYYTTVQKAIDGILDSDKEISYETLKSKILSLKENIDAMPDGDKKYDLQDDIDIMYNNVLLLMNVKTQRTRADEIEKEYDKLRDPGEQADTIYDKVMTQQDDNEALFDEVVDTINEDSQSSNDLEDGIEIQSANFIDWNKAKRERLPEDKLTEAEKTELDIRYERLKEYLKEAKKETKKLNQEGKERVPYEVPKATTSTTTSTSTSTSTSTTKKSSKLVVSDNEKVNTGYYYAVDSIKLCLLFEEYVDNKSNINLIDKVKTKAVEVVDEIRPGVSEVLLKGEDPDKVLESGSEVSSNFKTDLESFKELTKNVDLNRTQIETKLSEIEKAEGKDSETYKTFSKYVTTPRIWTNNKRFVNGYEDGTFRPENNITNAEVLFTISSLITNRSQLPASTQGTLPANKWYAGKVNDLIGKGLVPNMLTNDNAMNLPATRENVAKILSQFIVGFDEVVSSKTFSDTNDTVLAKMAELGYITGYPDGTFKPKGYITRVEFVTIINLVTGTDTSSTGANIFSDLTPSHWAYNQILLPS